MKFELDDGSRNIRPAEIEISDVPTARGTVSLFVDSFESPTGGDAVEIDREAATKICEHLIAVFGLLSLQPFRDEKKSKTRVPRYGAPR